jgi:hypothetical protein
VALLRPRPPHARRPELHRQPVDQPRHLACPRRLLDQALLRGVEAFGPVGGQREGVEPEFRIERGGLVGEQSLQMSGLAARNGRRNRGDRDAAIDPKTVQREAPRTEMPLPQLLHESRD